MKEGGARLFNKNKLGLVQAIVQKINAHLPHSCASCELEYALKLDDVPLFLCYKCGVPSHDCEEVKKIKDAFPESLPKGLIWLCSGCIAPSTQTHETASFELGTIEETPNERKEKQQNPEAESVVKDNNEETIKDVGKKKVCKHYIYKKCRHGLKGSGCPFDHPTKCFKYMRNGSNARRGCSEGKNCKYFHPPLCRTSVRNGVCAREDRRLPLPSPQRYKVYWRP